MSPAVKTGTPIARGLNAMLVVVSALLVLICLAFTLLAALILISPGIRGFFETELQSQNLSDLSPTIIALLLFTAAVMGGAYLYVVQILRALVKTLLAGDPFVPENISRLRIMWIVIACVEIFRMCFHGVMLSPLANMAEVVGEEGTDSMIDIRIGTWFLVFVIAALAEVFRHGAELRREQQLTV